MFKKNKIICIFIGFCFSIFFNSYIIGNIVYANSFASGFQEGYQHHFFDSSSAFDSKIFDGMCSLANDLNSNEHVIGYVKVEDFFENQTDDFATLKQLYKANGSDEIDEVHIMGFDGRPNYVNEAIEDALKDSIVTTIAEDDTTKYVKVVSNVFDNDAYWEFVELTQNSNGSADFMNKILDSDNASVESRQQIIDACGDKIVQLEEKINTLNDKVASLAEEKSAYNHLAKATVAMMKADPVHDDLLTSIQHCMDLAIAVKQLEMATGLSGSELSSKSLTDLEDMKTSLSKDINKNRHEHDNLIDNHNDAVNFYNDAINNNTDLIGDKKDAIDNSQKFYDENGNLQNQNKPTSNTANILNNTFAKNKKSGKR